MTEKQSFITEARREQIMKAAIQTLDEIGYVKTSLAQIAKRAQISTALISYHFSDKQDVMNHLLEKLFRESSTYILEKVFKENNPVEQLNIFIKESLHYQRSYPAYSIALIEIIFNAKSPENVPYYRLTEDSGEDPVTEALCDILQNGQTLGLFKPYDLNVMVHLIQGAIGESMFYNNVEKVGEEAYCEELIDMIQHAVQA